MLLHDGQKIIIKRSQSYGGRHEVGQSSPIKEHTLAFNLPNTSKTLTFKSEFSEDVGRANFNLLALHILNGTPYVVADPVGCLSYNKWGRPNPPYVIFKHDGKDWQRIQMSELPLEFKTLNVTIYLGSQDVEAMVKKGLVSAEEIKRRNEESQSPQYKSIMREAVPGGAGGGCSEMVHTNEGWLGLGFFQRPGSYQACLRFCKQKDVNQQNCPCAILFKGKK